MSKRVTVFCSSSDLASPMYFAEIELLAQGLAKAEIEIVYGGAKVGLMGRLADVALNQGGKVVGVIPEYLNKEGIVHPELSHLKVVGNLLDRKRAMLEGVESVIAFPGGIGTIDEVTEVLALKQLGEYEGQVLFLNFLDSWQPLFTYFEELKLRNMISQPLDLLYSSFDNSEDLLKFLTA